MHCRLSIIVPTRNRQFYCLEMMKGFDRMNIKNYSSVEVIIVDNSDDPQRLKRELESHDLLSCSWLRYIPPDDHILSMRQNWERGYKASRGDWISLVGDDDFLDFSVVDLLENIDRGCPEIEYLKWSQVQWRWPDARETDYNVIIPLRSDLIRVGTKPLQEKLMAFDIANGGQTGLSPYHACTRRSLIDKVRQFSADKQTYFFHENVDYVPGILQVFSTPEFLFSYRPFSVQGVCTESNSSAVINTEKLPDAWARYHSELSSDLEAIRCTNDPSCIVKPIELVIIEYISDAFKILGLVDDVDENLEKNIDAIGHYLSFKHSQIRSYSDFQYICRETTKLLVDKFPGRVVPYSPSSSLAEQLCEQGKNDHLARGLRVVDGKPRLELCITESFGDATTVSDFYYLLNQMMVPSGKIGGSPSSVSKI